MKLADGLAVAVVLCSAPSREATLARDEDGVAVTWTYRNSDQAREEMRRHKQHIGCEPGGRASERLRSINNDTIISL